MTTSSEPVGSPAASSSAGPVWNSVAGGCPTLSGPGRERIVDGPFGQQNGFDDATSYTISCAYGSPDSAPAVFVSIEIDRAEPVGRDWAEKERMARLATTTAGRMLVPLPGVGDGGFVTAGGSTSAEQRIVLASTWSGNAYVRVNMNLAEPVRSEPALTAQFDQIVRVLNEVLDDLCP